MRAATVLSAVLLVVPAATSQAQTPAAGNTTPADSTFAAATLHGQALANQQAVGGRFAGGFVGGLFLGLIGTGIAWAVASGDDTPLPTAQAMQLANANPNYTLAFQQGYSTRLKSRRKSNALTGGLVGTATAVVIIVAATSGN